MLTPLNQEERDTDDLVKEIISARFDPTAPLPPLPEYSILIGDRGLVELGGALIGVYGRPKTRKSSFIALIVAAALNEQKKHGIIEAPLVTGPIIWFDTEMGLLREFPRFHSHIVGMSGRDKGDDFLEENYHVYNLRGYSHRERLKVIDRMLMAPDLYKQGSLGMIVLDGVADLVASTNELAESKEVVDRLLMWADYHACPIFVALHLTASTSNKPTGFMGNYIVNKSSYNINAEVEDDGLPSLILPKEVRQGERFESFFISNVPKGELNAGRPIIVDPVSQGLNAATNRKRSKVIDMGTKKIVNDSEDDNALDGL